MSPNVTANARGTERDVAASVHAALRDRLAAWVGRPLAQSDFLVGEHGKPRLAMPGPEFSIAHSGNFGLIGISAAGPIGVDIEVVRPLRMTQERQKRLIAAAAEFGPPLCDAESFPERMVLQAWVRLEAIAKATGEGMGSLLTRVGIIGGGQPASAWPASLPHRHELSVRDLSLGPDLIAAVALSPNEPGPLVRPWAHDAEAGPQAAALIATDTK